MNGSALESHEPGFRESAVPCPLPGVISRSLLRLWLLAIMLPVGTGRLDAAVGNMRLILSGGGSLLPDKKPDNVSAPNISATFKNDLQAGASAAFDVRGPLELEAGFRISRSKFQILESSGIPPSESAAFSIQNIFGCASYHSPYSDGGLRLFAAAGFGLRRINRTDLRESDLSWSLNFGGGLEARASRKLSIRIELRDFVGPLPSFFRFWQSGGSLHDLHTSIGVAIHMN